MTGRKKSPSTLASGSSCDELTPSSALLGYVFVANARLHQHLYMTGGNSQNRVYHVLTHHFRVPHVLYSFDPKT